MTVIKLEDEEERAAQILEMAEAQCLEMLGDLQLCGSYYKDREHELGEAELKRVLTNVRQSIKTLLEERSRFDELRKRKAGIVHGFAIDFDSARSEIGRRLDRLRAAGSSGDVPE